MSAAVNRDLPIPGSPESNTTWPSPVLAFDQRRSSRSSSSSRPTSSVSPLACRASKRLSTEAGRNAAQARTGPEIPLRSCAQGRQARTDCPRASACSPQSQRCSAPQCPASAPQGSASRLRCLAPEKRPNRSGRRPPRGPLRCRHESEGVRASSGHLPPATNSSPARTARSASSSWACG